MTTIERATRARQVHFHDATAPPASRVVPSVFVAARWTGGRLLLVRRCDSGTWEMPGGRVDVGETAIEAAVRETAEESGVRVLVTGLAGLFSDPGHVVRGTDGQVRQQFVLVFRARAVGGVPRPDRFETSDAAWVSLADLPGLPMEEPVRAWITEALDVGAAAPYLG